MVPVEQESELIWKAQDIQFLFWKKHKAQVGLQATSKHQ